MRENRPVEPALRSPEQGRDERPRAAVPRAVAGFSLLLFFFALALALASPPAAAADWQVFTNRTGDAGLRFERADWANYAEPTYQEVVGGGACWGDVNNDGYPDFYLTNGVNTKKAADAFKGALYINNKAGAFTEKAKDYKLDIPGWGQGCAFADYDNDGYQDVAVLFFGEVRLFRNEATGSFKEVTKEAGINLTDYCIKPCWASSLAWLDYDRDGLLDFYVANYVELGHGTCENTQLNPEFCFGQPNALFHNKGDGTFENVAEALGVEFNEGTYLGRSLGVVASDFDNNGWPDLYVVNDEDENALYMNSGGSFTKQAADSGVDNDKAGMGTDAADVTGDGLMELISVHFANEHDAFFVQTEAGTWEDRASAYGLDVPATRENGNVRWGTGFQDFDNDGDLDLIIVNGQAQGLRKNFPQEISYYTFDGSKFVFHDPAVSENEVSYSALGDLRIHRSAAFADYDNDGDVDLLTGVNTGRPALIRANYEGAGSDDPKNTWRANHWAAVKLLGRDSNRDGIGTRVTVEAGDLTMVREVAAGGSYQAASDVRLHYGIGSATTAKATLRWPSGCEQVVDSIPVDTAESSRITITESCDAVPDAPLIDPKPVSVKHDSVRMAWKPTLISDWKSYVLFYSETGDFTDKKGVEIKDSRYTVEATARGLKPDTTYHFAVVVRDEAKQESGLSDIIEVRTLKVPPSPVSLHAIKDAKTDSLNVSWTRTEHASFAKYVVYRSRNKDFEPADNLKISEITDRARTWLVDGSLRDATEYVYRVRLVDTEGLLADSAEVAGTTLNAAPPGVTLADVPRDDLTEQSAVLRWSKSDAHDFSKYIVFVYPAGSAVPATASATLTDREKLSAEVTGLRDFADYDAHVRVVDAGGLATASNVVRFKTLNAPPPPVRLLPFNASDATASTLVVRWEASSIADFGRYEVVVGDRAGFNRTSTLQTIPVTSRDATSATVRGLRDHTEHFWRVRLLDAGNRSADSSEGTGKTLNGPPPATKLLAPLVLTERGGIELTWERSVAHDFSRYEIHVSASSGFKPSKETLARSLTDVGILRYTLLGLPEGRWFARIVVLDEGGLTASSPEIPLPSAASQAPSLLALSTRPGVVALSWTGEHLPADLEKFEIYEGIELDPARRVASLDDVGVRQHLLLAGGAGEFCYRLALVTARATVVTHPSCVTVLAAGMGGATLPPAPTADEVKVTRVSTDPGDRRATVTWWTKEVTKGRVLYGRSADLGAEVEEASASARDGGYVHTATLSHLEPGTRYFLKVSVSATGGKTGNSALSEFETLPDRTPPKPPSALEAVVDPATGAVKLTWEPSPSEDLRGYLVLRALDGVEFQRIAALPAEATAWSDPTAPTGVALRYRLQPVDLKLNALDLEQSPVVRVVVEARAKPTAPPVAATATPPAVQTSVTKSPSADGTARTAGSPDPLAKDRATPGKSETVLREVRNEVPAPGMLLAALGLASAAWAARCRARRE